MAGYIAGMSTPPLVFGTAGHVDHGKTSLVRALTGIDLDSLPEEKDRGITISLGFAPLRLPSGRLAGLVDVPGHERLVRTMVSGASGMDAVIFCVSAADGVMPQTREHLAILELLGVRKGIIVLTKMDLVDEELRELAVEDIQEQVRGSFLEGAPIVPTSTLSGAGLPELLAELDKIHPPPRDLRKAFRLPVDRAFARKGFGTVVTGTTWSGQLIDGNEVEIIPGHRKARVRGMQIHKSVAGLVTAGTRVALNLSGVEVSDVPRGSWICTPGSMPDSRVIDVRYQHLADAPELEGEPRVLVLLGTREGVARLVPLEGQVLRPGNSVLAQLRFAMPFPCLAGDHFVIRRESPARTLGGGQVLDPFATVVRKAHAGEAVDLLERMEEGDQEAWLERGGPAGLSEAEVRARFGDPVGQRLGDRWFAVSVVEKHRQSLHQNLDRLHAQLPLTPSHNRKALRSGLLLALGEREYTSLVDEEVRAGRIEAEGSRLRRPGFVVQLTDEQNAWIATVNRLLEAAAWEGVEHIREKAPAPDADALIFLQRERGLWEQVADRLYGRPTLDRLKAEVLVWFDTHTELDPGAFKELFGLTRKTAIPLLEWLDAAGVTRRQGDVRVRR